MMSSEKKTLERIIKSLSQKDQEQVKKWFDGYNQYLELIDPIEESNEIKIDGQTYFCRREAFVSLHDAKITYGYFVCKWNGTYKDVPLIPNSKKTCKFKNWEEIFHCQSTEKHNPKEMIEHALKILEMTKDE